MANNNHIILEITSAEKEVAQDPFINYSLKVKKYLETKATEVKKKDTIKVEAKVEKPTSEKK